jgi:pilus assembly protein CpaB
MRPTIVLAAGVIFASLTALMVYNASQPAPAPPVAAAAAPTTQPVVVAAVDMPLGTTLDPASLKTVEWPLTALPQGPYASPETLAGRVTLTRLATNEPVTSDRLAPVGTRGLLPLVIDPGMRAATVRVNDVTAINGFIVPGSRVDVLLTGSVQIAGEVAGGITSGQTDIAPVASHRTRTLLSNVTVLAMGRMMEGGDPKTAEAVTTATVLVSPSDAELLTLASSEGTLQLLLRNFADNAPNFSNGKSTPDLFGLGSTEPSGRAVPIDHVEVIRGSERLTLTFKQP